MDLDLSSVNNTRKSSTTGVPKPIRTVNRKKTNTARRTPDQDEHQTKPIAQQEGEEDNPSPAQVQHREDDDLSPINPSPVQVLDFHTSNPIISYHDQIYSCAWTDMIGTTMFFAQPGFADQIQAVYTTEHFDVLGLSRIKLVGHRADVKKTTLKRSRPEDDAISPSNNVQSAVGRPSGALFHTNPKVQAQTKKQAGFLERLMEIKAERGETDTVRAYVDQRTASGKSLRLSEASHAEVNQLNQRLVHGDAEALARLQEIYSQSDEQTIEPT